LGLGCGTSSAGAPQTGTDAATLAADRSAEDVSDAKDGYGGIREADGDAPTSPAGDSPFDASAGDTSKLADGGGLSDATLPSGRSFPDTYATIAILADQLPTMNAAQTQFAATHYVGTQKQVLPATQALRAINSNFIVLHYHLAMWQSAPMTTFLTDGMSWGNDYNLVTTHEDWFWHNASGQRVASSADQKLLMNVSVAGFQSYWATSLAQQVQAGDYDGIFLDSASPSLLQGECSGGDPRLAATAARDTTFPELGSATWIHAWETWISALDATLAAQGIPLIPNTGPFVTTWDSTNYGLSAGIFSEGFADPTFALADWQASTDELLSLAAADKIMILQNYLKASTDVATRLYYLGNYLLVKGHHTYLDSFASSPLEWYPEWGIDLGAPTTPASAQVASLLRGGVYRRDFAKGSVLVNPSFSPVTVQLGSTLQQVVPSGGGAVDTTGMASGTLTRMPVTSVVVGATSAVILLQ
jgi:Hypothetical glycosyl hydrolase family 15